MGEISEIRDIHDLHIWEITSQFVCLSVHVILDDMPLNVTQQIRSQIASHLEGDFGIAHAVIQFEC